MIDAIVDALGFAFMRHALAAGVLVSIACGVMGTFVVVKRIVFVSGGIALSAGDFLASMTAFIGALVTANTGVALSTPTAVHIAIGAAFLVYLPFTYMMHFVAKYFMYHEIRWNDEPIRGNASMEEEVKSLLGQPVTWAALHLGADGKKNWVDIATADVTEENK